MKAFFMAHILNHEGIKMYMYVQNTRLHTFVYEVGNCIKLVLERCYNYYTKEGNYRDKVIKNSEDNL